jgi:MFS family permease
MKRIWLTRNLILLTLVSLAQDAASELLYPLLPYIITAGVIGAAPLALGLIEGCAEAAAGFTKLWAGNKSDTAGRKPFVIAGYSLAAVGKALVIFATAWGAVFAGRVTDRIGKGLRSTPRDALISDSVEKRHLGKAFGFHRTGDNIGAVIGPLIALGGLALLNDDVRAVAKWALIPAILSGLLTLFVKETITQKKKVHEVLPKVKLPPELKKPIAILVLVQLTNIPDALLLLRLYDVGFSVQAVVLSYALYSLVTVLFAYPAGALADKFSPQSVYAVGLVAFAIAYATLGLTTNKALAISALIIYGIFPALTDGVGKAWIAKLSDDQHRGRAQGVYQASMNFAVLGAGIWGGAFWVGGQNEIVLVVAAVGALAGAIYFGLRIALQRFSH